MWRPLKTLASVLSQRSVPDKVDDLQFCTVNNGMLMKCSSLKLSEKLPINTSKEQKGLYISKNLLFVPFARPIFQDNSLHLYGLSLRSSVKSLQCMVQLTLRNDFHGELVLFASSNSFTTLPLWFLLFYPPSGFSMHSNMIADYSLWIGKFTSVLRTRKWCNYTYLFTLLLSIMVNTEERDWSLCVSRMVR